MVTRMILFFFEIHHIFSLVKRSSFEVSETMLEVIWLETSFFHFKTKINSCILILNNK